jgi:hypothetical protein
MRRAIAPEFSGAMALLMSCYFLPLAQFMPQP